MAVQSNDDDELMMFEARRTCCASCGIAEIDDMKLKGCDDCDLVKYCSDECQKNHKSEHEEECRKRAAELVRDELLFKQNESSYLGDCPICCVPLPLDQQKSTMMECCSKVICSGCTVANLLREMEMRLRPSCPFCRATTNEDFDKLRMKRVEANDPVAIRQEGMEQYKKGEYIRAYEYWVKAAELGHVETHFRLACMYQLGHGVEKDRGKEMYHFEEAAIGGHPDARYNLGLNEWCMQHNNVERAVKHFIIAATLGCDDSIKALKDMFKEGSVEKEDLAAAFRAHKAAVDATKSPQREFANKFWRKQAAKKV